MPKPCAQSTAESPHWIGDRIDEFIGRWSREALLFSIALAESIASFAAILQARAVHGDGAQAVGTSVSALHHRSARSGEVVASCTPRHLGRQVASDPVDVRDEQDRLLSTVTVATQLLPPR